MADAYIRNICVESRKSLSELYAANSALYNIANNRSHGVWTNDAWGRQAIDKAILSTRASNFDEMRLRISLIIDECNKVQDDCESESGAYATAAINLLISLSDDITHLETTIGTLPPFVSAVC